MDEAKAVEILEEYSYYNKLKQQILYYITPISQSGKSSRIRRGTLQRLVSEDLNISRNASFYDLMDQIAEELGLRPIMVNAYGYYRGAIWNDV